MKIESNTAPALDEAARQTMELSFERLIRLKPRLATPGDDAETLANDDRIRLARQLSGALVNEYACDDAELRKLCLRFCASVERLYRGAKMLGAQRRRGYKLAHGRKPKPAPAENPQR